MNYNVVWAKNALDFLNKLEHMTAQRIIKLVGEFSENPRTKQFKRLKGEKMFRLRAGDYRILFDFDENKKIINILKIGHRKNIYDR
jgi:mRNA interferase RelE/StbE